jgi:hypothetical protein
MTPLILIFATQLTTLPGDTPPGDVAPPATASTPPGASAYDHAPPPRSARKKKLPVSLDLGASTWLPLSVGPELDAELPGRVLLSAHLGWMPELYSRTLTDGLEDAGIYDSTVGALVDGALDSATTWRFMAGWRPLERYGLEVWLGYSHVSLSGESRVGEIAPLLDASLADQIVNQVGDRAARLESSLDQVSFSVGWRWLIAERLLLRANIGYLQAFDSSSRVEIEGSPALTALVQPTVDTVLHEHYMNYVKMPVVGLGVAYRFF